MPRAAIYARHSSALQQPSSIEDQVALCRLQAGRFNCTVLDDHIYTDREVSGSDERREGYQRLLDAAQCKQVKAIIVESQDRLWRNQAEMSTMLEI
jgi:DNA invertase Pin-like site-specific DNA recombinase